MGVCALGREALLKAAHTAEEHKFKVLHGIVDSLWLKKRNATIEEYTNLCNVITKQVGVPITFEGRYKWIAFLPSKMHPRIGVLNRYYGAMENGEVKVRGLEVRRRDTPRFVFNAQTEMIETLASANNTAELYKKIPEVLQIVKNYRQKLIDGEVPLQDLVITKRLSKNPQRYKQQVSQLIAAKQLIKEGIQVHAGNSIKFIFTHAEHKRYERRVRATKLVEKGLNFDTKKYLLFLYSSAANLLSFAGYTTTSIYDAAISQNQKKLDDYLN
jgi:DNA polymerase-2